MKTNTDGKQKRYPQKGRSKTIWSVTYDENKSFCNCAPSKSKGGQSVPKFREVEVDGEGICQECGFYAVQFEKVRKDLRVKDKFNEGFDGGIYGENELFIGCS